MVNKACSIVVMILLVLSVTDSGAIRRFSRFNNRIQRRRYDADKRMRLRRLGWARRFINEDEPEVDESAEHQSPSEEKEYRNVPKEEFDWKEDQDDIRDEEGEFTEHEMTQKESTIFGRPRSAYEVDGEHMESAAVEKEVNNRENMEANFVEARIDEKETREAEEQKQKKGEEREE